jgi:heme/copper-type cytochrome/quinol oxidase subunit 2
MEKTLRGTMPMEVIESYLIDPYEAETTEGLRMLEVDQPLTLFTRSYYKLLVTSDDVIHSWALPSLGVKIDACPGRLNEVILQIKDCGIYYGQCSEICGYYHGNMPIVVVSTPQRLTR